MVIRTVRDYRDKETKEPFLVGSFREVSDERGAEIVSKGLAVEYILKPAEGADDFADIPDEDELDSNAPTDTAPEEFTKPPKKTK